MNMESELKQSTGLPRKKVKSILFPSILFLAGILCGIIGFQWGRISLASHINEHIDLVKNSDSVGYDSRTFDENLSSYEKNYLGSFLITLKDFISSRETLLNRNKAIDLVIGELSEVDFTELDSTDPTPEVKIIPKVNQAPEDLKEVFMRTYPDKKSYLSASSNGNSSEFGQGGYFDTSFSSKRTKISTFTSHIRSMDDELSSIHYPKSLNDLEMLDKVQRLISRTPIGAPVTGRVTSRYGRRNSPFRGSTRDYHTGIDLAVDEASPVLSSADGIVVYAEFKRGYGNAILIKHPNGLETLYAHLHKILIEKDAEVCRGQQIGLVGSTGRSTGPHLHYEIRENGEPIDPDPFIELASILRYAH
jgi:murein DD-endopeptidase MepM/ murein hydrolase activator NlpD